MGVVIENSDPDKWQTNMVRVNNGELEVSMVPEYTTTIKDEIIEMYIWAGPGGLTRQYDTDIITNTLYPTKSTTACKLKLT
jgi:hypothetical protein